ncbi:MAG: hypothetical protein AAF518_02455 [Spirochaetota bacterium]
MDIQATDTSYAAIQNSVYNYAGLKSPNDDNKVSEVDNTNPVEEVHEGSSALLVDVKA